MNGTNYLDCVTVSSMSMIKNKVDKYLRRAGYTSMKNGWTLDKRMASLSTCHIWAFALHGNLAKSAFGANLPTVCGANLPSLTIVASPPPANPTSLQYLRPTSYQFLGPTSHLRYKIHYYTHISLSMLFSLVS